MNGQVRKVHGDYIDSSSKQCRTGWFWEIKAEGLVIRRAGSKSKKWISDHINHNFDVEEIKWS